MAAVTIAEGGDSDLDVIRAIAAGEAVSMEPALLAALQERCDQARVLLRDGRPVYGVNTGMGALHGIRLTGQQQRARQRNLLLARATGGPPWLDRAEARAIIGVRLLTFRSGDAAVSAELCQRLIEMLNLDLVPAIPRSGMGAAGEIMQLAHAFGPLAGIGEVLGFGGASRPAAQALNDHGLTEYSLGPKEGIALIQGVAGTTGLCVLRLAEAAKLTGLMEVSAALSIAAVGASRDPYNAALGRGDDILDAVLARIRASSPVLTRRRGRCRRRCRSGWPDRCSLTCTGRLACWRRPCGEPWPASPIRRLSSATGSSARPGSTGSTWPRTATSSRSRSAMRPRWRRRGSTG